MSERIDSEATGDARDDAVARLSQEVAQQNALLLQVMEPVAADRGPHHQRPHSWWEAGGRGVVAVEPGPGPHRR